MRALPKTFQNQLSILIRFSFLFCARQFPAFGLNEMTTQFVQHCSFVQSSFGEASPILEIRSDTSITHLSTVKLYFHLSHPIMLSQKINCFLAALQFIDYEKFLTYPSRRKSYSHKDTLKQLNYPRCQVGSSPRRYLANRNASSLIRVSIS